MSAINTRRAVRTKHDSVLEIYDQDGHFIIGIGRLVNFSNVGVCFSSNKILTPGDRLRVRLRLLREGTLEVSAHLVWSKKKPSTYMYGLAFDDVKKIQP